MYSLINLLGRFCSWILFLLPQRVLFFIGDCLGILWFDIIRLRRKVVMGNFDLAFPEWDAKKKTAVARTSMRNLGRSFIEFCTLPFVDKQWMEANVTFENFSHYEAARAKGKGVLLMSLHIGNGDMGIALMTLKGMPLYVISKIFKMRLANEFWFGVREKLGTKFIPPQNSSFEILRAIKKKGDVLFVLDQYAGPPLGVEIEFFGHKTGAAYGLALFSQKTGAPVVPVYTYRGEDGKPRLAFEPEIELEEKNDRQETLEHMTQVYTDKVEELVRRHPEQWMWVHRRWKKYKR